MGSTERIMEEAEHPQDDEDLQEGPPPGFHSIQSSSPLHPQSTHHHQPHHDDDGDDDGDGDEVKGPPPGFSTPPPLSLDACREAEENAMDEGDPPLERGSPDPPTPPKTPLVTAVSSDKNQKNNQDEIEDEDDGPPPGWNLIPPQQCKPSNVSPSSPLYTTPADIEMDSRRNDTGNESNIILPWRPEPALGQNSSPSTSLSKPPQSADTSAAETRFHQGDHTFVEENGHQAKKRAVSPSQKPASIQVPPSAHVAPLEAEKGQLVCGTCRQLLSYPIGAKYVKCAKCQEVNLVLEEHEVGQVKCGGCLVLLMYPYGSPAVRCSSCRFVTSVGDHNRRPPLSEQQARAHRRPRAAGVR